MSRDGEHGSGGAGIAAQHEQAQERIDALEARVRALEAEAAELRGRLAERDASVVELVRFRQVVETSLSWKVINRVVWPISKLLVPPRLRQWAPVNKLRTGLAILFSRGPRALVYEARWAWRRAVQAPVAVQPEAPPAEQSAAEVPGSPAETPPRAPRVPVALVVDARVLRGAAAVEAPPVDIVICVHNAVELLRGCLESIERHTDLARHRMVIIDDASTDPDVTPLLEALRARLDDAVLLLPSSARRGFVHSCNVGMRASARDVILLNTDTVVTSGWVDKLAAAAYSERRVASVTPFSNHAVMCSIPQFCARNTVPDGFDIQSYAALVERASLREYPDLPNGTGFCMYLRREALDEVGLFDEETFGLGYGEECDWSYRAADLGWRNVLDDATYIYHHGGGSFGDAEKTEGEQRATATLIARYPRHVNWAHEFMRTNPLGGIHERIRFLTARGRLDDGRVRVVEVLPFAFEASVGGAVLHGRDLVEHLRVDGRLEVATLVPAYPEDSSGRGFWLDLFGPERRERVFIRCERPVDPVFYPAPGQWAPTGDAAAANPPEPLGHAEVERTFDWLLRAFGVGVVHYHGFVGGFPPSLIDVAARRGVRQVLTAHDWFFFCYNFTLFEKPQNVFCAWCRDDLRCMSCMSNHWQADLTYQGHRRRQFARTLARLDLVVSPSEFVRRKLLELTPEVAPERCVAVEHGSPLAGVDATGMRQGPAGGVVNVAIVGFFGLEKGSRVFLDLVRRMRGRSDVRWFVFGDVRDVEAFEEVRRLVSIEAIGKYTREELPGLLRQHRIDLALLLSPWPETYSYTLSEMICCDVPVLGLDIGALGERIRATGAGLVVDPADGAAGVERALVGLLADPERLASLRATSRPEGLAENAARYSALYRDLAGA